jgi:hypothetical protein
MIIFRTKRLVVRRFTGEDKDNFFRLSGNPSVMQYIRAVSTRIDRCICRFLCDHPHSLASGKDTAGLFPAAGKLGFGVCHRTHPGRVEIFHGSFQAEGNLRGNRDPQCRLTTCIAESRVQAGRFHDGRGEGVAALCGPADRSDLAGYSRIILRGDLFQLFFNRRVDFQSIYKMMHGFFINFMMAAGQFFQGFIRAGIIFTP